jgi:ATP-binding cassette subfamily C protein
MMLVLRFKRTDEEIVNYSFHFSGGERQRLALVRVFWGGLLLDEATSSLDTENEKQIMELFSWLKLKCYIIFVTHRTVLP